jgi:hypothetical protein
MTTNISYIDTEFIKELNKEYVSPKEEYWKPVESTAGVFYKQYIVPNTTFFILLFLIILLLLYRYRSVKNDKENYPEKYEKKYLQQNVIKQQYEQSVNPVSYTPPSALQEPPPTIYKSSGSVNYPNSLLNPYNQGYLTQPFFQPYRL